MAAANRWLSIRLEAIGNTIIAFVAALALILHGAAAREAAGEKKLMKRWLLQIYRLEHNS